MEENRLAAQNVFRTKTTPKRGSRDRDRDRHGYGYSSSNGYGHGHGHGHDRNDVFRSGGERSGNGGSSGRRWLERPPKFLSGRDFEPSSTSTNAHPGASSRVKYENDRDDSHMMGGSGSSERNGRAYHTSSRNGEKSYKEKYSRQQQQQQQPQQRIPKQEDLSSGRILDTIMDSGENNNPNMYEREETNTERNGQGNNLLSPRASPSPTTPNTTTTQESPDSPARNNAESREILPPLSPAEPPQIQLAHHQQIFDIPCTPTPKTPNIKHTPIGPPGIEGTPSFSLFSKSFDSFAGADDLMGGRSFHMVASTDEQDPKKQNVASFLIASPFSPTVNMSPHVKKMNSLTEYINKQPSFIAHTTSGDLSFDGNEIRYLVASRSGSFGMPPTLPTKRELNKHSAETTILLTEGGTRSISDYSKELARREMSPTQTQRDKRPRQTPVRRPSITAIHPKNLKQEEFSEPSPSSTEKSRSNNSSPSNKASRIPPISSMSSPPPESQSTQQHPPGSIRRPYREHPCPPMALPSSIPDINAPVFYRRLNSHKAVFEEFTFVLPALRESAAASDNNSSTTPKECPSILSDSSGSPSNRSNKTVKTNNQSGGDVDVKSCSTPSPVIMPSSLDKARLGVRKHVAPDAEISRRRVVSAVYAFGGSYPRKTEEKPKEKDTSKESIFREKDTSDSSSAPPQSSSQSSLTTASSTTTTTKTVSSDSKTKYELTLADRYFEHDNRISWEAEEDPPVEISKDIVPVTAESMKSPTGKRRYPSPGSRERKSPSPTTKKFKIDDDMKSVSSMGSGKSDQPKMRYRCKLCGQPKQNHICPYQQSLQRSIGVMVYPVINAFTATEPGYLAPALSEMNNFVTNSEPSFFAESTPARSTHDRVINPGSSCGRTAPMHQRPLNSVTPDNFRSYNNNPGSPRSISTRTPLRVKGSSPYGSPYPPSGRNGNPTPQKIQRQRLLSPPSVLNDTKSCAAADLLFSEPDTLRPEQYRVITPSKKLGTFKYPALPLPYPQRKSVSDNLFAMSKEIPQLTDECALVLRQAREKDMWDLAVAELMTQVIVVVHCPESDTTLEGLSQYLLSLGFSC